MATKNSGSGSLMAGGVTLLGMSLPWAHVGRCSVPGWSGSANFIGIACPGYLVALVAGLAIAHLRSKNAGTGFVPLLLCGYGVFHSGFTGLALAATHGMTPGVGIPITILSFALIVFCAFVRKT